MLSIRRNRRAAVSTNRLLDHWFALGDCNIYVRESPCAGEHRGDLIFIHGRLGCSEDWGDIVQGVSNYYRCLTIDLPGFGRSFSTGDRGLSIEESAHLVLQVIAGLSRGSRPVLVGHDTGGGIAEFCAFTHPRAISGLILINSACLSEPLQAIPVQYRGWGMKWRMRGMLKNSPNVGSLRELSIYKQLRYHQTRGPFLNAIARLQESWPCGEDLELWTSRIASLLQPSLVLWGARDKLNPPERGINLIHKLVESDLFQSEKCCHWPCLEDPEWVLAKMRDFLFRITFSPSQTTLSR